MGTALTVGAALCVGGLNVASAAPALSRSPQQDSHTFGVVAKSKIKIAIVAGGPNVVFAPWGVVANLLSKKLGITVTFVVPPTPTYAASVETATIDSLVAKGYNAFGVFPDGEAAITPTYQRLIDRGIPVFDLAGCTTDPTPADLCFATNVRASAQYETQVLIKAMGGKGNIAFLTGELTDANTIQREDGVKAAIAATGGKVTLAQVVSNIDTPSAAPPAVESLLASKGSTLTGMLSTDYYPSVAAASILSKNKQFQHILFIGQDNDPTVMNALAKHAIYGTMYQNLYGQAYVATMWLYKMLADGCTISPKAPFINALGTKHFIDSGYFFVGQKQVGQYIGKPETVPTATTQVLGETSKFLSCP